MIDPEIKKNREQLEEQLDKTIQDFVKRRKKRFFLIIFYVVVLIPSFFLLFNIFWTIYLYRIDSKSVIRDILNFVNVTLLLSLTVIGFTFYVIDKKLELSDEDTKSKFKDLSKYNKFYGILIIIGCVFVGGSIFLGQYLLIFFGPNIFTIIFIILEYIGLASLVIGAILIST